MGDSHRRSSPLVGIKRPGHRTCAVSRSPHRSVRLRRFLASLSRRTALLATIEGSRPACLAVLLTVLRRPEPLIIGENDFGRSDVPRPNRATRFSALLLTFCL